MINKLLYGLVTLIAMIGFAVPFLLVVTALAVGVIVVLVCSIVAYLVAIIALPIIVMFENDKI